MAKYIIHLIYLTCFHLCIQESDCICKKCAWKCKQLKTREYLHYVIKTSSNLMFVLPYLISLIKLVKITKISIATDFKSFSQTEKMISLCSELMLVVVVWIQGNCGQNRKGYKVKRNGWRCVSECFPLTSFITQTVSGGHRAQLSAAAHWLMTGKQNYTN